MKTKDSWDWKVKATSKNTIPYVEIEQRKGGKKPKKKCFLSQFGLKIYCIVQNEAERIKWRQSF